MKKNFIYATLSAIALVGAVGFSACSSSDEVIDNPNYDSEKGAVKTEFVFNVTQPGERTRQTSTNVGNESFLGIDGMYLFCFNGTPATTGTYSTMASDHKFSLDDLGKPSPVLDGTETTTSSKVYTLYIPTETSNLLFYATAKDATTTSGAPGTYGQLTKNYTSATTVDGISFSLVPIVSTAATVTTPQGTLVNILNDIEGASITELSWFDTEYTAPYSNDVTYKALRDAYSNFTNQASNYDVRQGSAKAIINMVGQLFTAVNDVYKNEVNTNAKALAGAILAKIATYFKVTSTGTAPDISYTGFGDGFIDGTAATVSGYPGAQGLPDGSAVLVYNSTTTDGSFSYINDGTMGASSAVSLAYDAMTYPSELTYYCNSLLRQSAQSKQLVGSYPTTSTNWVADGSWASDWSVGAVSAATRAVAMKENITYGAAQLASTIQLKSTIGDSEYLTDNAAAVTSGEIVNNVFDGSTTDKTITLKVHGILIGGQPDAAQFEYLPVSTNTSSKVIYDLFSTDGTAVTTSGTSNYTLALDNFVAGDPSTTDQAKVNIALEMSADKDFYGKSGYIKANEKFYLIGQLDPTATTGVTAADWTKQPSFKDGSVEKTGYGADRVFIRDAKTEVTFTIGATSLQNAYSTIPDLRSTQMLFGLSVDLVWKTGLIFNVPIN